MSTTPQYIVTALIMIQHVSNLIKRPLVSMPKIEKKKVIYSYSYSTVEVSTHFDVKTFFKLNVNFKDYKEQYYYQPSTINLLRDNPSSRRPTWLVLRLTVPTEKTTKLM